MTTSLRTITESLGAAALLTCLVFPAAADWAGSTRIEDGITHVDNPNAPMHEPSTVKLDAAWTIGGDTDDEDEFFGVINQIQADDDGNIYLLDIQLSTVKVFSPDGEYIREFGSEGEGPGEFRFASDMFLTPQGNVGILQTAPGRIVQFGPDGSALSDHAIPKVEGGGFTGYMNGRAAGETLVLGCFTSSFAEQKMVQTRYLAAIDTDGNEIARYHSEDRPLDLANPVIAEATWDTFDNRWTAGADGRVYAVPKSGDYSIRVWAPDGSLERIVHRDVEPYLRNDDEKAEVRQIYEAFLAQMPNAKIEILDTHRTIEAVYVREDNSLWVLTSRGARDGDDIVGTFDVFDAEGRFTHQVTVDAPGDPLRDRYMFAGDRLFVISGWLDGVMSFAATGTTSNADEEEEEEAEPIAVTCYRLEDTQVALN
jgi:hypothetical protein